MAVSPPDLMPRTHDGSVRVLTSGDLAAAVRIAAKRPVENVFVAARLRAAGIEPATLGCPIWGYERDGELRAICHAGSNLIPVNADPGTIAAWAEFAGPHRTASSIVGPSHVVLDFWQQLSARWGRVWADVRQIRASQPVMALSRDPLVPGDRRVRRVSLDQWDVYAAAAVRMYTEEVGVSPAQGNSSSYRYYVRQLITSGRAFAIIDRGRVLFKADLGSVSGSVGQVQGVWVDPELRGQGIAAPAMAAVVQLARRLIPTVSLYVNDFNAPARATYRRVGFTEVGEFATVHY